MSLLSFNITEQEVIESLPVDLSVQDAYLKLKSALPDKSYTIQEKLTSKKWRILYSGGMALTVRPTLREAVARVIYFGTRKEVNC